MPIQWDENLAIGVPAIDGQHRELFARVATFEGALERRDATEIARTLSFLRDYAFVHFAQEEQLMRGAAYPRLDAHRASHAAFVDRLSSLAREHEATGPSALLGLRARNWIVVWLLDHVGIDDVAVGRHLRARAAP